MSVQGIGSPYCMLYSSASRLSARSTAQNLTMLDTEAQTKFFNDSNARRETVKEESSNPAQSPTQTAGAVTSINIIV